MRHIGEAPGEGHRAVVYRLDDRGHDEQLGVLRPFLRRAERGGLFPTLELFVEFQIKTRGGRVWGLNRIDRGSNLGAALCSLQVTPGRVSVVVWEVDQVGQQWLMEVSYGLAARSEIEHADSVRNRNLSHFPDALTTITGRCWVTAYIRSDRNNVCAIQADPRSSQEGTYLSGVLAPSGIIPLSAIKTVCANKGQNWQRANLGRMSQGSCERK